MDGAFRFACFLTCLLLSVAANCQDAWRSSLYPSDCRAPNREDGLNFAEDAFLQDFSYAGYRMGASALRWEAGEIFDAVEAFGADPSGQLDATAAIQAAIDAAEVAGGGVVYLKAGSYRLSVPEGEARCLEISSANIILRGEGTERTYLFNTTTEMRNKRVIRIRPSDGGSWTSRRSDPIRLTRDELGPTNTLQLESLDGLAVGDWLVVHNPATESFVRDLNMASGADGVDWTQSLGSLRGLLYLRQVQAIDTANKRIQIDIPTRWSLKTRDGASVYKTASLLSNVALEAFSIGNKRLSKSGWSESDYNFSGTAAYDAHGSFLIEMRGVVNGWIQNVSSYNPGNDNDVHCLSNGVLLDWCRNVTLHRLRFQNAQYGGGGGNGYMIRLNAAAECLVVESEVGNCRHGIVMWRMQNSGNVITRCYDHDSGMQLADTQRQSTAGKGSDHHGIFSHSNLFDGNLLERSYLEAAYRGDSGGTPDHAMTSGQSVYWNTKGKEYHVNADFIVHSQQFGQGYVIGTSGEAAGVKLEEKRPNSAERTDPQDFLEGLGAGETLQPASLYQDQLRRRLGEISARLSYRRKDDSLSFEWEESPSFNWALEKAEDLAVWETVVESPVGRHEAPLDASALFFRLSQL
ncbi:glycosyl hydrolase family 28-related protein [Pelagicoccus sp. SDUM812005]|uniref:glycosyl hydrolase family 28-related protein n=1 Tax=Pelagicoccus sp. SDUM812005 TaxID=3041257 RepID=UPI00280CD775|nr:glycosyl hydrolase family 28-related protein [Pelagicoccus sp. SDUM812005]MDQ8182041.1 glycosyl hydrolase family 28-related protein [Pelagicoccus sp. SDUM812005]